MSTILAIDLGGTQLRAGVADVESPAAVTSVGQWAAPDDLSSLRKMLDALVIRHDASRLGCAIPGLARGTTCVWVPNLGYLDGFDLATAFPDLAVGLGHDAQLALLAEVEAGAARDLTDAILLAIGTGIGSAVLAGGRIVRGATGAACSFGWATADIGDAGDERLGWLERNASGRALDAAGKGLGLSGGRALINAAASGSVEAAAALEKPMTALGAALAGAVGLLDPGAILLTGGVATATDTLAGPILAAMRRHLPPHLRSIDIRAGGFGPKASLVGAAFAGHYGPTWGDRLG
jgi:glucokinase